MKVSELISMLQDFDEDADVLIMSQESWPFECAVHGVVARSDFDDIDGSKGKDSDVFIVEGHQIRYGSKQAWEV